MTSPQTGDELPEIREDDAKQAQPAAEPKLQGCSVSQLELEQLRREAQDYKDKYLRLLAESENMRKRLQKERQEMIQFAIQNVVVDFLHPIDHMENALKHVQNMSDEIKNWGIGFQMILTQFKDALANNGVQPFDSTGAVFDPYCHEAIEVVQTHEVAPGIVVEERVKGYKMGERIIRPARVTVSKEPVKTESHNTVPEPEEK